MAKTYIVETGFEYGDVRHEPGDEIPAASLVSDLSKSEVKGLEAKGVIVEAKPSRSSKDDD